MPYDLLIFDLDGTLVDTADDIADSLLETLAELGRPPIPRADIVAAIGNGVRKLVEKTAAPPHEPVVEKFLETYSRRCLFRTKLYPGVAETLDTLAGRKVVLTNKPLAMSLKILGALGIAHHFERVYGGDSLPVRKPDPEVVRRVMADTGARRPVLIGDSGVDVATARAAGIPVIAVTYGYFKTGELDTVEVRVERFSELTRLLK